MAAAQTDMFKKTGAGTVTTLAAPGKALSATSITVGATTNHPTDTGIVIAIRQVDSAGELVAGTYTEWSATVTSGTTFGINAVPVYGSDQVYAAGSTTQVYIPLSSYAHNKLIDGILEHANQDGSLITAAVQAALNIPTTPTADWSALATAPTTITYNGNRSYDVLIPGVDYTDRLSNGMRLKLDRTVTPPTQCTNLEASSSQYWSKTSPAGISFTTTFTCAAWVKLESYGANNMGIIARRNADTEGWSFAIAGTGQVSIQGLRVASNHKYITSYQSIPLNKWVHVAACLDMTAGDTTAQKIWIDGVEVPRAYTLAGTATALVQGTTALVVGAEKSAGTNPFDGKIAQASVHSACLSDAQIKAMASQTIDSSTPSIVSGFTFNGAATDVSANANDLTASGGATYGTDSPFNSTEYGIITANSFSTDTTLTVQVPEGYAIPTSGGVSAVAYSTQSVPYGFPRDEGKWAVEMRSGDSTTSLTSAAWTNTGSFKVIAPIGAWEPTYAVSVQGFRASGTGVAVSAVLSESTSAVTAGYEDSFSSIGSGAAAASQPFSVTSTLAGSTHKSYTSATAIYWLQNGTLTSGNLSFASGTGGSQVQHSLKLLFAYL